MQLCVHTAVLLNLVVPTSFETAGYCVRDKQR
jgi:hypothetical protein